MAKEGEYLFVVLLSNFDTLKIFVGTFFLLLSFQLAHRGRLQSHVLVRLASCCFPDPPICLSSGLILCGPIMEYREPFRFGRKPMITVAALASNVTLCLHTGLLRHCLLRLFTKNVSIQKRAGTWMEYRCN